MIWLLLAIVIVVVTLAAAASSPVADADAPSVARTPPGRGRPITSSTPSAGLPLSPRFGFFAHQHHQPPIPVHTPSSPGMVDRCTELRFDQPIDHFGPSPGTYRQRYFVNDEYYHRRARNVFRDGGDDGGGPMFFYLGNEADVTLYVNATGLIWENAAEFGALIVFAEHRYYGESHPFPRDDPTSNLEYLSAEQALMDYVTLIDHVKSVYEFGDADAVIGFGGSYGGMLATWGRLRYPHVFDGVIAASAPVVSFEGMDFDEDFYARGVTYDVTTEAGASEFCEANLREAFEGKGLTKVEPSILRSAFDVCPDDNTTDDDLGWAITGWISTALSFMSMGNFPYPSTYILNGDGSLPAFPVRVACDFLSEDLTGEDPYRRRRWLEGLASFAGVYYNYTRSLECNTISAPVNERGRVVGALWDYQYCSQIFQVFAQHPDADDMYWDDPWDGDAVAEDCFERYGFQPDRKHFPLSYGTPSDWARDGAASNIVWSQGEYDPWRGGGVGSNLTDSLVSVVIEGAAHHLDLFFSHEDDTEAVVAARGLEMAHVRRWVEEKRKNRPRLVGTARPRIRKVPK